MRVILLAALLLPLSTTAADIYELTTEELAPFNLGSGDSVGGLATDVLREAFGRAGFKMKAHLYPWLRAYQSALERSNGCVYSTVRSPERESLFKWVGPIIRDEIVLLVREGSGVSIGSIDDLKRYRTAATPGDWLSTYLQEKGANLVFTPTRGQLQMLMNGRIDFWATTRARGAYFAAREKVKLNVTLSLREADMYLACNPNVPDSVIKSLNDALGAMEQDGTMRRLEEAYR